MMLLLKLQVISFCFLRAPQVHCLCGLLRRAVKEVQDAPPPAGAARPATGQSPPLTHFKLVGNRSISIRSSGPRSLLLVLLHGGRGRPAAAARLLRGGALPGVCGIVEGERGGAGGGVCTYVSNCWKRLLITSCEKQKFPFLYMFYSTFSRLDELDSFIGGDGVYNFR